MPFRGPRLSLRFPHALSLTGALLALVVACATPPAGQPPIAPVNVRTAPAAVGSVAGTLTYSGDAQARAKVSLLPKVSGQITALNVDVGSAVKKGDVIAELDHATQDAQIAQAKAGLAAARARLASIQAGPRDEMVAQARANLQAAQENLAFLKSGGRPENVVVAAGNLATAQARLASLQKGRSEAIAQATANLRAAQARLQELKNGPTPDQIKGAQLAVEQAKDAAYAANVQKDAACNPAMPRAGCDAAQAAAFAAQTAVDQANVRLKQLTDPPTPEQLQQAQAAVDAAQAQLQIAERPGSSGDIQAAAGAVQAAQAQLDLAKAPFSSADLAKAETAVVVAEQQLKLAEKPYTKEDEDAAAAAVAQAEAALEMANVARDQTIVRSPIDGIVAQKLLTVGSLAAPTTPIVILIDPTIDVTVQADSVQAASLRPGDAATITADALPGRSIAGKITTIAPAVDPKTRTVEIKITPDDQAAGLKDGMLAQVTLVTATHEGVLLVPASAVVQRNGQATVYVVSNGTATPVAVQIGLSDGVKTEIVSGLQAGQLVVVSGQDRLTTAQPVVVQQ